MPWSSGKARPNSRERWQGLLPRRSSGQTCIRGRSWLADWHLSKWHKSQQVACLLRLNVYKDEILLNTVVETCIKHKETHRLQAIVSGLATSGLRPSVHTYGTIIKACSVLRRVRQCRELWHDMVVVRAPLLASQLRTCPLEKRLRWINLRNYFRGDCSNATQSSMFKPCLKSIFSAVRIVVSVATSYLKERLEMYFLAIAFI